MDQRERLNDNEEALRVAMEGHQSGLWTALPGILQSFDDDAITAVVQPSIQGQIEQRNGTFKNVDLPLCLDCPVVFPSGGGFALTFPLTMGDEGLLVFSSRCIDAWQASGGIQTQAQMRMHDLSDGFFIPGCFSKPRALSAISTTTVQLRSSDGETFVEVATGGVVNVTAPTQINLKAPIVDVQGVLQVNGVVVTVP